MGSIGLIIGKRLYPGLDEKPLVRELLRSPRGQTEHRPLAPPPAPPPECSR